MNSYYNVECVEILSPPNSLIRIRHKDGLITEYSAILKEDSSGMITAELEKSYSGWTEVKKCDDDCKTCYYKGCKNNKE